MHKLVVNPDTASVWENELKSGANSIGRNQKNDVWIDHSSISSVHCQIVITEQGTFIKDLGSTGGTFIDDSLIEEAPLASGQMIRLGDVNLRFEPDLSQWNEPLGSTAAPAAASQTANNPCKFHPKAVARYLCPQCEGGFCDLCVTRRNEQGAVRKFCRTCGVECSPLKIRSAASASPKTFASQIVFGGLYFPMAFLAVTMADSLSALNPLIIIPSILKIAAGSLLMVILTVAIVCAGSFGELLLPRLLPVPVLPSLISEFLALYLGTVEMRLLGLLHWTKKEELAWFSR